MNRLLCLIVSGLLLTNALAQTATLIATRSPHPTQLMIQYKKELRPVLRMEGSDPVVMLDGKEKRVRQDVSYLPTRVPDFSPHRVEVSDVRLGGTQMIQVMNTEDTASSSPKTGSHGGMAEFSVTLKAKETLQRSYVAVVLFSPMIFVKNPNMEFWNSNFYQSQVVVRELPELPAGVALPLKYTSKMFDYVSGQQFFVQVFDGEGREVLTNVSSVGWPYYSMIERFRLKDAITRYQERFSGQNHAVAPIVRIKPLLPDNTPRPTTAVIAQLTVSSSGWVTDMNLSGIDDSATLDAVREALMGWLFFPKLINGQPVETLVEVPIQF